MPFEQGSAAALWPAQLTLGFERRGGATVLAQRAHRGPLLVQKPLYPEGAGVCHAIVVHPPAGIAGGDHLAIEVHARARAHALITTPGATRWYRTPRAGSQQTVRIIAEPRSVVEWLPQESIVFDGARSTMVVTAELCGDAVYVGMDVVCLGRTASGERFRHGWLVTSTRIVRDGRTLWLERGEIAGEDPLLDSPAGLAGQPVTGTLLAAAPEIGAAELAACRTEQPAAGRGAATLLPGLLVARYLGPACEPGRDWLARIWSRLRFALTGREPTVPRIWRT